MPRKDDDEEEKEDSMASFRTQLAALNPVPPDNDIPSTPSTAAVDVNVNITPSKQPKAIHAILAWGFANGRETGWRAKDLGVDGEKNAERIKPSARFQSLLCQDVRELNGYLAAKPEVNHHNERHAGTHKFIARKNNEVNPISFLSPGTACINTLRVIETSMDCPPIRHPITTQCRKSRGSKGPAHREEPIYGT
jgi:hypothetical protein